MAKMTITEGLAEIKTVAKRVQSKRSAMLTFQTRLDGLRDPITEEGGSAEYIRRETQAADDLVERIVAIRRGITRASDETAITINGESRSILDWLTWRRDVAPGLQQHLQAQRRQINEARVQASRNGSNVVSAADKAQKPTDVIVNLNETALVKSIEVLEDTLGQLDGQLSLKNATVMIEVPA